jgi:hypothetical protein
MSLKEIQVFEKIKGNVESGQLEEVNIEEQ